MSATWNFNALHTSLPTFQTDTTTYYSPSPSPSPSSDTVPPLAFGLDPESTLERTPSLSPAPDSQPHPPTQSPARTEHSSSHIAPNIRSRSTNRHWDQLESERAARLQRPDMDIEAEARAGQWPGAPRTRRQVRGVGGGSRALGRSSHGSGSERRGHRARRHWAPRSLRGQRGDGGRDSYVESHSGTRIPRGSTAVDTIDANSRDAVRGCESGEQVPRVGARVGHRRRRRKRKSSLLVLLFGGSRSVGRGRRGGQ